jgi:hypothetical protein
LKGNECSREKQRKRAEAVKKSKTWNLLLSKMRPERRKDIKNRSLTPITDFIEKFAAESGHFEGVDEDYYRAFLELSQAQIEKLTMAIMLSHERDVRRLAGGLTNSAAVDRVTKLVRNVFHAISIGLAQFDAFGQLGFVSRIGPKPWDVDMDEPLERKHAEIAPMIENTVRRDLPWLLSREITQGQLPL